EKLSYGQLATAAQAQRPPRSVKLKGRKSWKLLDKPMRRLDTPEKITGKAQFGIDVRFEGLRTALVARSPVFGGQVKSFDAGKALAVNGVEKVVQVPSGVAVVARDFWSAKLGREALQIDWDLGRGATLVGAEDRGQSAGEGLHPHPVPRRRIRSPRHALVRLRQGGRSRREGGRRSGEGDLNARGRHARRVLPAALPPSHRGGAGREGKAH